MQIEHKLLCIKLATSAKCLNFVADPNSTLKQIRDTIQNLNEIQLNQYIFLMKDKSPISSQAETHVKINMIINQNGVFYVQEDLKIQNKKQQLYQKYKQSQGQTSNVLQKPAVANADVQNQIKHIQTISKFNEFEQKIQELKAKIQQFNKIFATKINALPKIDAQYQGQFSEFGLYQGMGRYLYPNGQIFIGTFKNGQRSGLGCYTFKNGDRYQGEYKNNVACGLGTQIFTSGCKMSAEYKKNSSNGMGIFYFSDGSKLLGNFIENNFHGEGVRVYPDGTWKNQKYNMGNLVLDS